MYIVTSYCKPTQHLFMLLGVIFCLVSCQNELIKPKLPASTDTKAHSSERKVPILQLERGGLYSFTYTGLSLNNVFAYKGLVPGYGYYFNCIYPKGSSKPSAIRVELGSLHELQGYIYLTYNSAGYVSEATYDSDFKHTQWIFDYDTKGRMTLYYENNVKAGLFLYTIITYKGANVSKVDNYLVSGSDKIEEHFSVTETDSTLKHPFSVTNSYGRLLVMIAENFSQHTINGKPFRGLSYLSMYGTNVIKRVNLKSSSVLNGIVREDSGSFLAVYKTDASGLVTSYDSYSGYYGNWDESFAYQTFSLYLPDFP
ncbi:hypothetical protein [Xanthocytophaga flava]|uniref:hypothetical protein n=1 Tax=Xanthocytophaga flava TaxID=3048013 RepID=UPI0028D32379|nr:hypothetical protein [Xanthocytophaga flavus]MDJ1467295.1 hypothetical protein [Xanthocytophaga flavus]